MLDKNIFKGKSKLIFEHYIEVFKKSKDKHNSPYDLALFFVNEFKIFDYYIKKEGDEKGSERTSNISEMLVFLKKFKSEDLHDFFETVTLQQDIKSSSEDHEFVNLMTIHSSKGLEFPIVFLVGIENNIIPSSKSMNDSNLIEEERRLMYVAITRAMRVLNISYSPYRFNGKETGKSYFLMTYHNPAFLLIKIYIKLVINLTQIFMEMALF